MCCPLTCLVVVQPVERSLEAVMLAADLRPADPVDLTLTGQTGRKKTQSGTTEGEHTLKQEHPSVSVMVVIVRAHTN